jgi:glycosyltransferase involved in cell wall biosynthesis
VAVRALALLRDPCVRVVLRTGPADYRADLEKLAAGLGVLDRVTFTGDISERLYAAVDVVVCPWLSPLPDDCAWTAMSAGRPVIVSELLMPTVGRCGEPDALPGMCVVTPGQPLSLSIALRLALGDRALAGRMARAGRRRARSLVRGALR